MRDSSEAERARQRRRRLHQEIAIRAAVALLVLAFNEFETVGLGGQPNAVTRLVSLSALLVNVVYYLGARTEWRLQVQRYIRMLGDIGLITVGLYGAGGLAAAQYIGVYTIIPVYVGIALSSRACLISSALATGAYLAVAFATRYAPAVGAARPSPWIVAAFNLLILNIVAVLTAVLSEAYRRSRRETRESEQRFKAVAASAIDAIVSADAAGNIVSWNPSAESMFGYAESEIRGQPLTVLMPERLREAHRAGLARFVATGQPRVLGSVIQLAGRRKDGTEFPLEIALSTWEAADGRFFSAVIRDITERKSLEDQLRQAQKMDAIGRLAGGVAHDFNNVLTAILGYSALIAQGAQHDPVVKERADEISKAATRAAALTRQLLTVSRRQIVQPTILYINGIVADTDKMLRRLIGEDIDIVTSLDPDAGPIMADAGQIHQVVLNLAINARDAMPGGGQLTIQTANVELDPTYARLHVDVKAGAYVMLAVSDTGSGMDAETKSHIFEPFFTTKEPGKGTGLGLSTVYGIVRQNGGTLSVYTEVGHGSTFKVYFPRVAVEPEERAGAAEAERPPRGSERVLLVEDEESVRKLSAHVLRAAGYTVLEADDPITALALLQRDPGTIELMITDMIMPYMSGRDLAHRAALSHPRMKVLYISGYPGEHIGHDPTADLARPFLPKPFTPEVLAVKAREVLDG